jgi:hypothetical protein
MWAKAASAALALWTGGLCALAPSKAIHPTAPSRMPHAPSSHFAFHITPDLSGPPTARRPLTANYSHVKSSKTVSLVLPLVLALRVFELM